MEGLLFFCPYYFYNHEAQVQNTVEIVSGGAGEYANQITIATVWKVADIKESKHYAARQIDIKTLAEK